MPDVGYGFIEGGIYPVARKFPISPYGIRQPTGLVLTATPGAGLFNFNLAANVLLLQGEAANNNTKTDVGMFQFQLPTTYRDGGPVTVRIKCANIGSGTQTSCTITVTAYEADGNGAVGSNLGPAAQTHAAKTTWYTKDFVITPTGLVAGDTINVVITVANIESAASNLVWTADEISVFA